MSADDQRAARVQLAIDKAYVGAEDEGDARHLAMEVERLRAELAETRRQLAIVHDAEYSRSDALTRRIEKMGTAGDTLADQAVSAAGLLSACHEDDMSDATLTAVHRWRSVRGDAPAAGSRAVQVAMPDGSEHRIPLTADGQDAGPAAALSELLRGMARRQVRTRQVSDEIAKAADRESQACQAVGREIAAEVRAAYPPDPQPRIGYRVLQDWADRIANARRVPAAAPTDGQEAHDAR